MAGVTIDGLPEVLAASGRVEDAGVALGDLSAPSSDASALALGEVRAPVRTGALANTVAAEPTALGFTLTAGGPSAPYAGIVHARNPFLTRAVEAREGGIVDTYADFVDTTLDTI